MKLLTNALALILLFLLTFPSTSLAQNPNGATFINRTEIGQICNDQNPCTQNDVINDLCECVGELIDGCVECEENSSCDDNNPCTFNDVFDEDCNCGGTYVYGCIECETNSPCDDNNPCTVNDVFLEDCTCEGTTIDDCDEDECDVGMACDDNDPCTINDVFLENCECQGEESLGAYIIDNQEGVCENIERTLSVSQNFTYYEWTYEGLYFSNNNSINALTSGLYSVEVSNNNCSEILTYRINDYEGHNNDIIKEPNSDICTDEGLQLEIKSGYTNAMWTNSDGEIIDNSSVNEEGIYYVSVQDENNCTLEDGVYVKKVIQGCFIEPVDAFTCINNPISLKVSGIEIEDYTYEWSNGSETSITEVAESGEYFVTITDKTENNCSKVLSIDVKELTDENLIEQLENNGFVCIPVVSSAPALIDPDSNEKSNACILETAYSNSDYTLTIELDGEEEEINSIHQYLTNILDESCSCNPEGGGIFVDNFCESENSIDLETFLNYHDEYQNGAIKAYLQVDENGEGCLFFLII